MREKVSQNLREHQPKLKKQLQYASSAGGGAEFAAIVGESELRDGTVTLKHLASGEQRTAALDAVRTVVEALRAG